MVPETRARKYVTVGTIEEVLIPMQPTAGDRTRSTWADSDSPSTGGTRATFASLSIVVPRFACKGTHCALALQARLHPSYVHAAGERLRDERRKDGGPRMHGRQWHDHDEPHELERVADNAGADAVIESESGGERTGMGTRRTAARAMQSRQRRKRSVPPNKGLRKRGSGNRGKEKSRRALRRASAGSRRAVCHVRTSKTSVQT
jgi:hypothetical protein